MTALCVALFVLAVAGWVVAIGQTHAREVAEIDRNYHRNCHRIWEKCADEHLRTIHEIAREYVIVRKRPGETARPN